MGYPQISPEIMKKQTGYAPEPGNLRRKRGAARREDQPWAWAAFSASAASCLRKRVRKISRVSGPQ